MSRGLAITLLSERNRHPDGGTGAGPAFDRERPSNRADSFPDGEEAEPVFLLPRSGGEAPSIISDIEYQARVIFAERHGHRLGPGMSNHVVERFLSHPEKAEPQFSADRGDIALGGHLYRQPGCPANLLTVELQRSDETHMVECRRVQAMGKLPERPAHLARLFLKLGDVENLTGIGLRILVTEPAQAEGDQGQALANVVVQLARDPAGLLLSSGDQVAIEPSQPAVSRAQRGPGPVPFAREDREPSSGTPIPRMNSCRESVFRAGDWPAKGSQLSHGSEGRG
jgi:hypothetical protein